MKRNFKVIGRTKVLPLTSYINDLDRGWLGSSLVLQDLLPFKLNNMLSHMTYGAISSLIISPAL